MDEREWRVITTYRGGVTAYTPPETESQAREYVDYLLGKQPGVLDRGDTIHLQRRDARNANNWVDIESISSPR